VPVRYLKAGALVEKAVRMLMVVTYSGKVSFYPIKDLMLGESVLPTCFVFDAKMRVAAAQVGSIQIEEVQDNKTTLALYTFEGLTVLFDSLMFDVGTHDYYSALTD